MEVVAAPVAPLVLQDGEFSEDELKLFSNLLVAVCIKAFNLDKDTMVDANLLRRMQFDELKINPKQAERFLKYIKTSFGELLPEEEDVPF